MDALNNIFQNNFGGHQVFCGAIDTPVLTSGSVSFGFQIQDGSLRLYASSPAHGIIIFTSSATPADPNKLFERYQIAKGFINWCRFISQYDGSQLS